MTKKIEEIGHYFEEKKNIKSQSQIKMTTMK